MVFSSYANSQRPCPHVLCLVEQRCHPCKPNISWHGFLNRILQQHEFKIQDTFSCIWITLQPQTSLRECCLALCLRRKSLSKHLILFNHKASFPALNCQVPSRQAASHKRVLQALLFSDRFLQAMAKVSMNLCSKYFPSYFFIPADMLP